VDTHPDQFNVINSTSPAVINNTINNLWFHVHLFEDMNYPPGKMVIHIGGSQGGKKSAMQRFIDNLADFPVEIRQRLALENDDRTFDARDVLSICHKTNNPMVLDVHHHFCNNHGQELSPLLKDIFATWQPTNLPPKVHFSSPRDDRRFRNHHDYIDGNAFMDFVEQCLPLQVDFDVMLEAKRKDQALFKLVQDVQVHRKNWRWIDGSTLEV
jgi:UV DNA damage endonuclease